MQVCILLQTDNHTNIPSQVYFWVCKWIFLNRWILGKAAVWCTLRTWPTYCYKTKVVSETITFLLVTWRNIYRFIKKFIYRLSNKPVLIWSLTTPPRLKYVATLPCNLSLMACFADIIVLQGGVATQATCDGIFNIRLTTNLPRNLLLEFFFLDRLWFNRIMVTSLCQWRRQDFVTVGGKWGMGL